MKERPTIELLDGDAVGVTWADSREDVLGFFYRKGKLRVLYAGGDVWELVGIKPYVGSEWRFAERLWDESEEHLHRL